jgi:hypothetical protein
MKLEKKSLVIDPATFKPMARLTISVDLEQMQDLKSLQDKKFSVNAEMAEDAVRMYLGTALLEMLKNSTQA